MVTGDDKFRQGQEAQRVAELERRMLALETNQRWVVITVLGLVIGAAVKLIGLS